MSQRASVSLYERGVDRGDIASMTEFVVRNGGSVTIRNVPGFGSTLSNGQHVAVSLGGHTHGGYLDRGGPMTFRHNLTKTLYRGLVECWDEVLTEADTLATEAQVDAVLA